MDIEPITQEEFEALYVSRARSYDHSALSALQPMTGIKFPCRWKHRAMGGCSGHANIHPRARRMGFRVNCTCRDGTFYVFRYE